jgi:hypothetical protein
LEEQYAAGARVRDVLVHRGDVDDAPRRARGAHPPGRLLGARERADQVDLDDVAELRDAELVPGAGIARARVVDEHVEPAERVGELADDPRAVLRRPQVEVTHLGAAPERADLLRGALGAVLVAAERDPEIESLLGQAHGGGLADA